MSLMIKREPTVKEEEREVFKNSPTTDDEVIDLTLGKDDDDEEEEEDDEGMYQYLSQLKFLRHMLLDRNRIHILRMFNKKFGEGKEVMDEFINWGESNMIDNRLMKWVATVLKISYEELEDTIVWEEKK